ncbi:2-keto-3-deoxy-L-fuconate dehydrogenase [Meinhardsimonia xiamenensis]|jgi:2-keto-3-deoxy-L-fuconate dehydrogenase|uniref:2-keto-3-deoxy-L-fuconate dehydrogenase n=1 Tax=Meinhardsimonia xiamenensis TaxID=990712 RepID=A0A1G9DD32_9RHOB|nr:SDR family oxidoreductase [Meinhardsimonia xiamenensis]PRX38036.1 2-keto-3-deoxy-L-fuconate dehydrogenase [Meinhardsimonia xiamenensis]SDK61759.1 2-keto-3-deoxy-L-fuconate dehydrogenase [Meinhardsimonia xiamenensis]
MAGRLQDRTALITGAGQGIGREIALAFAAEGARVIAASRTAEKMADLPERNPAIRPVALDVGDAASVDALGDSLGQEQVDILVNCAGWVANGALLESSEEDWARSWAINVMGPVRLIRLVLPGMIARRRGNIINVASVASSISGVPGRCAYGTTKAALIGLTKSVARDYIASGVRCNALCPGTTASPSLEERIRASEDPEATRRAFIARQPMGRLGTPQEMAATAVWMASDESAFMTGSVIVVDGGQTL